MQVIPPSPPTATPRFEQWLSVDQAGEELVTVLVVGSVAGPRAEGLWSSVEYALEVSDGRNVRVDLTRVTGFDLDAVYAVKDIVRTATRRHDNIQIMLLLGSALEEYAYSCGLVSHIVRTRYGPSWGAGTLPGMPAGAFAGPPLMN
jgi:hypothetical protein